MNNFKKGAIVGIIIDIVIILAFAIWFIIISHENYPTGQEWICRVDFGNRLGCDSIEFITQTFFPVMGRMIIGFWWILIPIIALASTIHGFFGNKKLILKK